MKKPKKKMLIKSKSYKPKEREPVSNEIKIKSAMKEPRNYLIVQEWYPKLPSAKE